MFVVEVFQNGKVVGMAVLSSQEKVKTWLDTHYDDDMFSAVTAPFIVDEPDWGNVRVN